MKTRTLNISIPIILFLVATGALTKVYLFKQECDNKFISGKTVRPSDTDLFVGSWKAPINNNGFRLYKDGRAESINSNVVAYKRWHIEKGQLHLLVIKFINNTEQLMEDIYNLDSISEKQLILFQDNSKLIYEKI